MIKFSISHSKILDKAGEASLEAEHALHLKKAAALIESTGAKILEVGRTNVTACFEDDRKFFNVFKIAEHELEHFYGFVKMENQVFARWIDHLEHHCEGQSGS